MSDPTGRHKTSDVGKAPGQRPSFDRPSLFAGMEGDDALPEDTQRVRILSTLESTRQVSKPKRHRRGQSKGSAAGRNWPQIALWSVMSVGVLALFAGFILVIQDTKPAVLQTVATAKAATPAQPLAAKPLEAVHEANAETVAGPALIETTAHAATLPVAAATALSPRPSAALAPPRPMALGLVNEKPAAAASTTGKPAKAASSASKTQDEDVALLEAMFAHTGRKAMSPKATSNTAKN